MKKTKVYFIAILVLFTLSCYLQPVNLRRADIYTKKSNQLYNQAISEYKAALKRNENKDIVRFKLGQLYYNHGEYDLAIKELACLNTPPSQKLLAISFYKLADYTSALDIFNRLGKIDDAEYLFYWGLTCEKLNLYGQAQDIYRLIKDESYIKKAEQRLSSINRVSQDRLKDLDSDISEMILSAPKPQDYPSQPAAVVLFYDETMEVFSDNRAISDIHAAIKIFNERGIRDHSEIEINYDATDEKVELEYARSINPDGKVTVVGDRHIRDVSKYLNFPLYSNARVRIISMPELAAGTIVEYKARIYTNQLINKKDIALAYRVQEGNPIRRAKFRLILPKGRSLSIKILNEEYNKFGARLSHRLTEDKDRLIYNWEFKDIPEIIPESNMLPEVCINPTILISTFKEWDEIHRWWWPLAKDKIKADEQIRKKVDGLIKDKNTSEEKARAIYNFCAQDIRYVAVEYGQAGYEPHPASEIFSNKYGDCKDQAILLITMLKEAGINAWPVLIATEGNYELYPDFPAVLFNHCIAVCELDGKFVFLDPTAETCSFGDLPAGDQERKVLVFKEEAAKVFQIPLYSPEHNRLEYQMKIKINDDETILVSRRVFTAGQYDQAQRYWLRYTPPQIIEENIKEKIREVSTEAELLNFKIENRDDLNSPINLSLDFKGSEYLTRAGDIRIFPQLGAFDTSLVAKEKREYPLDLGLPQIQMTEIEFEIPATFKVRYLPKDLNYSNAWIDFSQCYELNGRRLYFKESRTFKKRIVSQFEYGEFKKLLEELGKDMKQRTVLEEK